MLAESYSTRVTAKNMVFRGALKEMQQVTSCCPKIYSIHLWNDVGRDGVNPDVNDLHDEKDRTHVDLGNWDKIGNPIGIGGGNFDYGFWSGDQIIDASGLNNPPSNTPGVGINQAWFAARPGAPSKITYPIHKTIVTKMGIREWRNEINPKNPNDPYNLELWCVQCQGNYSSAPR